MNIQRTIEGYLQANSWFQSDAPLRQELAALSPAQLSQVLQTLSLSAKDCAKLAPLLDLVKLQDAVRIQYPQHIDALQTAQDMLQEARRALQASQSVSPSLSLRLSAALDALTTVIEGFLSGFGIADFFKHPENSLEAELKGQKIMTLLHLATLLISMVGTAIGSSAIGGTLLGLASFSLVYPSIRPTPARLLKAVNWTRLCQQGHFPVVHGRKKTLDEIAQTLLVSTKVKTHPLLIGKSGAGKTETAKAFVQAIERGDYPALKGKRVFYFNTADLVQSSEAFQNENKALKKISEEIGRHRNNIVLVFDEIHLACQKDNFLFGEQLKTLLDPGPANLPYVIGITTEEEYYRDIYVNNAAFARRFKRIHIESPAPNEIQSILSMSLLQQAPKLLLDPGALKTLQEKVQAAYPRSSEPIASLKILSRCIQKTTESPSTPLEEQIERLRQRLFSLQLSALLPYAHIDERRTLEEELKGLEKTLQTQQKEIAQFNAQLCRLADMKTTLYKTIVVAQKKHKERARFLLLSHFALPAQEQAVRKEAMRLQIPAALNATLIDQVIREDLDMETKAQRAVERGKEQLREREK